MPYKKTKRGYVYDPKGKLKIPTDPRTIKAFEEELPIYDPNLLPRKPDGTRDWTRYQYGRTRKK
jgi:hypothetical protein